MEEEEEETAITGGATLLVRAAMAERSTSMGSEQSLSDSLKETCSLPMMSGSASSSLALTMTTCGWGFSFLGRPRGLGGGLLGLSQACTRTGTSSVAASASGTVSGGVLVVGTGKGFLRGRPGFLFTGGTSGLSEG